jgi:hypothetical protein
MDSSSLDILVYTTNRSHRDLHVICFLCRSDGKIHDFAGSYYISVDNMAFGEPYKYVPLKPDLIEEDLWDEGVKFSDNRFKEEEHNLFWYYFSYKAIIVILMSLKL